jgi:hypothetical protein
MVQRVQTGNRPASGFRWFKKTNRWVMPPGLDYDDLQQVFFLNKVERSRLCSGRDERKKLNKPKRCPTLDELCIYFKLATGTASERID